MSQFESVGTSYKNPPEVFSPTEQQIIKEKIHVLTSLVYLIGKDYGIKVEVNPRSGWHWDFKDNVVRVDPHDLLTKPMEYLRFVMSHEAGHRRISRVKGVIPDEVWSLPGFSFLMNAIEDPRDNNFVADNIPNFREEMKFAYGEGSDEAEFEESMKEKAQDKFGKQPLFMQAGFEYIRLWYQISIGEEPIIRTDLPAEVRTVVEQTLPSARRSWNTYPTLKEADYGIEYNNKKLSGEETVVEYARASFNINYNDVWPLFKTLVDKDIDEAKQKKEQEQEMENSGENSPPEPISQAEAEAMVKEFADELAKYFESEQQKSVEGEEGEETEGNVAGNDIAEEIEGIEEKPAYSKEKKSEIEEKKENEKSERPPMKPRFDIPDEKIKELLLSLEQRNKKKLIHEQVLQEYGHLIDQLTFELQEIFNKRRHSRWESGYTSGKKIHIGRAIQEEVRGKSPFETGVFMRREQPQELDYVIDLLVDLSVSMQGDKIQEAHKAIIVLSEVLNNIGLKFAVTGFNKTLHDFKIYEGEMDDNLRRKFAEVLSEVNTGRAKSTDDGWALDTVHKRILAQEEKKKIVFIISDGEPNPSYEHENFDLKEIIEQISEGQKVKLIGFGLGSGTKHVEHFYPNSVANITTKDLAKVLTQKVREAIEEG